MTLAFASFSSHQLFIGGLIFVLLLRVEVFCLSSVVDWCYLYIDWA
jgi:hypothetical protein